MDIRQVTPACSNQSTDSGTYVISLKRKVGSAQQMMAANLYAKFNPVRQSVELRQFSKRGKRDHYTWVPTSKDPTIHPASSLVGGLDCVSEYSAWYFVDDLIEYSLAEEIEHYSDGGLHRDPHLTTPSNNQSDFAALARDIYTLDQKRKALRSHLGKETDVDAHVIALVSRVVGTNLECIERAERGQMPGKFDIDGTSFEHAALWPEIGR